MADFINSECIVCKERFKDGDDIVVCPQCGTPYHRECYQNEGKCINTKLHEENISWSQKNSEPKQENGKKCVSCNTVNKPHSIVCENCGASLVDNIDFGKDEYSKNDHQDKGFNGFNFDLKDKYCGIDPEEAFDKDVNVSEAAEFIGSNTPYYLILFKRMKDTGKKITLNAVCILFPQFYFANRKMWLEAILTIFITTLLSVPGWIYMIAYVENSVEMAEAFGIQSSFFEIIAQFTNYATMGLRALACLFANWLYYRHMIRKIKAIKNSYDSEEVINEKIQKTGGTSFISILVALAIQMLFLAAITWVLIRIF